MDPTMTGGEHTLHRIDTTEQGTTTLAGGSKTNGGLAVGHTTTAYPLNHAALNFEPRTENTRPNFQKHRPLIRESGDVLNN